jgi:hypothetical protein
MANSKELTGSTQYQTLWARNRRERCRYNRRCLQLSLQFKSRIKSHLPFANIIRRFNVYGYVHRKYIPIYISNKMQRYTVYSYLETALHVSGGTSTQHQERIQLYL